LRGKWPFVEEEAMHARGPWKIKQTKSKKARKTMKRANEKKAHRLWSRH